MGNTQPLGGTRQSTPLDDEMTYPLTSDEYLVIKENLSVDKFSNWESFLLTTGFTSSISLTITLLSSSFEITKIVNGKEEVSVNMSYILTILLYSTLLFGSFLGFFIYRITKRKSEKAIHRLDNKIMSHLKKVNNE